MFWKPLRSADLVLVSSKKYFYTIIYDSKGNLLIPNKFIGGVIIWYDVL